MLFVLFMICWHNRGIEVERFLVSYLCWVNIRLKRSLDIASWIGELVF